LTPTSTAPVTPVVDTPVVDSGVEKKHKKKHKKSKDGETVGTPALEENTEKKVHTTLHFLAKCRNAVLGCFFERTFLEIAVFCWTF